MNKEQYLISMSENNLFMNKINNEINNRDIKIEIIDENKESFTYYILFFIVIIFILKLYFNFFLRIKKNSDSN